MQFLKKISDAFWNEDFWLPQNVTWKDVDPKNSNNINYTDYRHIWWPIPISFVIILLKIVIERYFAAPIGRSLGISATRPNPPEANKILEAFYKKQKKPTNKTILQLTKQLDMTERQVERWLRRRKAQDKPTTLKKFCECVWRCIFFTFIFIFGIIVLWDKPWLWDIKQCLHNYPHQSLTNDIWWYFMISLAYYWSVFFTQFTDVRRKDFWMMFLHHIITLLPMFNAWISNLYRISTLLYFNNDFTEIIIEGGKSFQYAKYNKTSKFFLTVFAILWPLTKLYFFPKIMIVLTIEFIQIRPLFPAIIGIILCTVILFVLYLIWTYMLILFIIENLKIGQVNQDNRSSSDEISDKSS